VKFNQEINVKKSMSQYNWNNCPTDVKTQILSLVDGLAGLLAENIIGIYLHGSLAMGCFNPQRSDLDLLVVTHHTMDPGTKQRIAEMLLLASCAPNPIEISFLHYDELRPWQYPTPYDFHYSETWRETMQQALQSDAWQHWNKDNHTDPDLAAHITITNQRGICLLGTPINEVMPDVPKEDYRASILNDIQNALNGKMDDPLYSILNVCRVCAFVRAGLVCSKQEGALWALKNVPLEIQPVIKHALEIYADEDQPRIFDPAATTIFIAYMQQHLYS
jgi:streptomycin 3"-adenylyltransferase